jgi:DNA-binding CsgD family transcriptional regulator/PAS domain-containing protein
MLAKREQAELLDLLYDAATDPSVWEAFLALYGRLLGAQNTSLIVQNSSDRSFGFAASSGVDPETQRLYGEHYWKTDEWLNRCQGRISPGFVFIGQQLCPETELLKSEFYNDLLRHSDDLFHEFAGFIAGHKGTVAIITSLRSRRRGAFGAHQLQTLKLLMPHLQRALRVHQEMIKLETRGSMLESALDLFPTGVILLDAGGSPTVINRRALELIEKTDGLSIKGKTVYAVDSRANFKLAAAIKSAVACASECGGDTVMVARTGGRRPLSVFVTSFRIGSRYGTAKPVAALFITDPDQSTTPRWDVLSETYHLTAAECRLAMNMAGGMTLQEMSNQFGVTVSTLRSQLQNIFGKTATSRQAELVRLLLQERPLGS